MDDLLIQLRQSGHSDLPRASKTLLNTSRHANPTSIDHGIYCHIGIRRSLMAYFLALSKKSYEIPQSVTLDFNIDEVSCSKSTQIVLWLIQMSLRDTECDPFVIAVFQGKHKPDCNTFLKEFVDEVNTLISEGFNYKNLSVRIDMGYFCCDTPAVSYIRGSKGHTGFNSCVKCTQKGLRLDSRLVFPYISKTNRTDEDFRSRMDINHHVKTSILETIHGLDMVHSFPLDEMHIVHLGVVKKLISFWIKTFSKEQLKAIETSVKIIDLYRPIEIRRQIRLLTDVAQFKANECRTFLLITGPVILKEVLDTENYKHFLLLHCAMRKLSAKNCTNEIESIRSLLVKFVREFKNLYGLNQLTYVVHSLLHLCDDAMKYGCTTSFSAYRYENNNSKTVKSIRHKTNIAQQIHNRQIEKLNIISIAGRDEKLKTILEKLAVNNNDTKDHFEQIIYKGVRFDKSNRNRYFLTKSNEICSFDHAEMSENVVYVACKKIMNDLIDFYDDPFKSTDINIFYVREMCEFNDHLIESSLIQCKMFAMPVLDGFAFFPISDD